MEENKVINSNFLQPRDAWDRLSLAEKAEMMKAAVNNGIFNLQDIRDKYNEFAEGGYTDTDWSYNSWKRQIAERMGIRPDEDNTYDYEAYFKKYPEEAWKMLKGDPDAHFSDEFKTVYHPTFSSKSIGNDGSIYSGVRNPKTNPQGLVGGTWSPDYHTFTMSPDGYRGPVGMDDRKWYLENAEDNGVQLREADGSLPIYDGIPWGGVLPNVTVYGTRHSLGGPLVEAANEYKKGGGIHIKPENRGKFTALKKRTGHSATWFKQHGTPAQKKMATFAINAAKWKHGDGGNLFSGEEGDSQQIQIGKPYYSYGENGRRIDDTLNYNISFPEIVITPDSKKSPAERAVLERNRRKIHDAYFGKGTYNAKLDREQTELEKAANKKAWERSFEGQFLNKGRTVTSGVKTAVEFMPVAGDIIQGLDASKDAVSGNYLSAGLGLGMLAIPNLIEKPLKYLGKGIKNIFELTDNQWDEAYSAAVKANDMEEAQKLRDLHFAVKAPETKQRTSMFNASGESTFNEFNGGETGLNWFSESERYAANHGVPRAFYINEPDIYFGNVPAWVKGTPANEKYIESLKKLGYSEKQIAQKVQEINKASNSTAPAAKSIGMGANNELVTRNNNTIKLADAITYDDTGNIIPLSQRDNFAVGDIRYLKGTDIDGNIFELPMRTMRGGIKDADGNIVSDEMLVNNWKRSQDFYKMRLRSRGLKQPGKTLKADYDTMFAELQKRFPDATAEEVEAYIKNSGGGFAIPEVGFGAVDKKLNTTGKQMKGTTNNAKIHEDSHLMGTPTEEIIWSNILDINLGEAAARGTQIKSMLGIADNTPITADQLKYMKDNYVRLTRADNNMQAFLDSITDFDLAADWLSRNSYSMGGAFNLLNYDFLKYPFGGFGL